MPNITTDSKKKKKKGLVNGHVGSRVMTNVE